MKRWPAFALLVIGALSSAPASAYVPPSQFILKNMAGKHTGLKGLRAKSTVSSVGSESAPGVHFKQTTVYDPSKRVLRSRAFDDSGKELFAIERPLGAEETSAKIKEQPALAVDALLLDTNLPTLTQTVSSAGVPIRSEEELLAMKTEEERRRSEVSFLSRWKNRPNWVIGKKEGNQLWVEKDVFLPTRLVLRQNATSSIEIQFDTHRFIRDFPMPKGLSVVQVERSGPDAAPVERLLLREDLGEVAVTADLASEFKAELEAGFTEAGNAADASLRELIQTYYRYVR